jgi:nucleoside-triphosphatase THEP1
VTEGTRARIGLLTGRVGVGKTTVGKRVVALSSRQGLVCGGLLAPAMKDASGQKVGIWGTEILTGERRVLARVDRELGGPTVGPYSFDAVALAWAAASIERAMGDCDLLIVDEIGKLELWQGAGLAPVVPRLAAGAAPRALVLVRDTLLAELQARLAGVELVVFQVTEQNRKRQPPEILKQLGPPTGRS